MKYFFGKEEILIPVFSQIKKVQEKIREKTTAFFNNSGYRVTCSNKKDDANNITISPKKFKNTVSDASFDIKGRLVKILVDDLNDDGFPDLLL